MGEPGFLTIIDESHVTVSQIGGMYAGDRSRKDNLVEYGFRLPSARDNRPLMFEEFEQRVGPVIYTSATPGKYEYEHSEQVVEQIIRPTGLIDPELIVRPIVEREEYRGQVQDFIEESVKVIAGGGRALATTLRLMAEVKVIRRWPRRAGPAASPPPRPIRGRGVQLVAIGASTGGPAAVVEILAELPATLRVPILVVQHIAKGFVSDLVQWWAGQTALGVKLAQEGDLMHPATVYVAPDDWQLGITPTRRIRLTRDAAQDGFRPSACHLFESVAAVYGASAMGVLLTGMGGDGAAGLKRLREAGGLTVAQDQETSVVFGMPGEAIRLGAAEYVLSPGEIAALIKSAASRP